MEDSVSVSSAPSTLASTSAAVDPAMKSPNQYDHFGGGMGEGSNASTEAINRSPRLSNHHQVAHELPEDRLLAHRDGVTLALEQAKMWSKYAKDLIGYLEKRTQIEIDYHRSIVKNALNLKTSLCEEVCVCGVLCSAMFWLCCVLSLFLIANSLRSIFDSLFCPFKTSI